MLVSSLPQGFRREGEMWKPEMIGLFIISLAISTVNSLYFHIAETERKCFIEEIPDDTTVIGMVYIVWLYLDG